MAEHDDLGNPAKPAPVAPKASDPAPVAPKPVIAAPKAPDPEPVAPKHIRLESGTMRELMAHIKAWLEWDKRRA
jgi:hypothetical protein